MKSNLATAKTTTATTETVNLKYQLFPLISRADVVKPKTKQGPLGRACKYFDGDNIQQVTVLPP